MKTEISEDVIKYTPPGDSKRKKAVKHAIRELRMNKSLYVMIIPVIVFYILFSYRPMYGALIAFKNYTPSLGVWGSPWADFNGMEHFIDFFTGPYFWRLLKNTVTISLSVIVFGFPMPIILALLINELRNRKFVRVVQTITYMPHFISLVVVCGLIRQFTGEHGIITQLLMPLGITDKAMLLDSNLFVPIYVLSGIWQEVGFSSIIYIAALAGVDQEQYEAARIDGAGRWKQLLHITLPGIMPTITIMLILRLGGIMNVGFEKIILLYNPLTYDTADVISSYVYRRGLNDFQWSLSSAVGLFNSVINFFFLITANGLSKKFNNSSLW